MSFARSHHRLIATALGCLDPEVLRQHRCLFAGGTSMSLRFGEYRESVDIDFVVSDVEAYRLLREMCRRDGFDSLTIPGQRVVAAEPLRIDQYGIRTRLTVMGTAIKFEIIREARIDLDPPGPRDVILGVASATVADLLAIKLLANSDRWSDPTVFNRDIIDLAMVRPSRPELRRAIDKATRAYGQSVCADAQTAIAWLLDHEQVLDRSRRQLGMSQPRAVLVDRLRALSRAIDAVGSA